MGRADWDEHKGVRSTPYHSVTCAQVQRPLRCVFRAQGHFPADHWRVCNGYYTLLTGTVFEKTQQQPATPVWMVRGNAVIQERGDQEVNHVAMIAYRAQQLHMSLNLL